jgi:hypothetical protein
VLPAAAKSAAAAAAAASPAQRHPHERRSHGAAAGVALHGANGGVQRPGAGGGRQQLARRARRHRPDRDAAVGGGAGQAGRAAGLVRLRAVHQQRLAGAQLQRLCGRAGGGGCVGAALGRLGRRRLRRHKLELQPAGRGHDGGRCAARNAPVDVADRSPPALGQLEG